jgi:8-oxo-dGTP pyrophosphatase MutT (NUDIX family)
VLLDFEHAAGMSANGTVEAAVLVPIYGWPERPGLVFTERRADLRRHAGEISFPGGRRDEADESLAVTALRETEEEVGLPREAVQLAGALPPFGTFVTNYKVHPIVGLIPDGFEFIASPTEVQTVLSFSLEALRESFAMRRLVRRGLPIRTPTYELEGSLIWGATARILGELLSRLQRLEAA